MGRVHERPGKFLAGLVDELLEWAEHEFRLDRKLDDGATERDHLESAARQLKALGRQPKAEPTVDGPPFPDELDYLYRWFMEISLGLASSGMAPAVVTWRDITDWQEQTGEIVEPWEARALVSLGALRASIAVEKTKKKAKTPSEPKPKKPRK
ncbi:MAG: hypothetical protein KIS96_03465 [Bauldia sp.]|nr:hypothetical protein [Bauldia sp.]